METEVKIPAVGESITSGVLAAWAKKDGDWVQAGEALFNLETDKVATEVTAPQSGLLRIQVPEGSEVKIGEVVAHIQESEPSATSIEVPNEKEHPKERQPVQHIPMAAENLQEPAVPLEQGASVRDHEQMGIHPFQPEGLGPAPGSPEGQRRVQERVTRSRLSPLRRKIAAQLVMAQQTAAMLTTFNECNMEAVLKMRSQMQEAFQRRHGVKLGLMSVFLKASVAALRAVPQLNARLEGEDLIENHFYDIGVAVGTERGLIVPVIREADRKSFAELEKEIAGYAAKAREGKIKIEELQGGVFTISNGGIYGSLLSTPILNAPQCGILGLHKIQERPIALEQEVVIRPMMYLALSYDHRVVDGREAVTFLLKIKELIEEPFGLLLET